MAILQKAMRCIGCNGDYLGETRSGNRLIANLSKKTWTRRSLIPQFLKSSPGHHDVNAKETLAGHEGLPIWREWIPSTEGRYVHQLPSQGREITRARSSCGSNELFRLLGESVNEAVVLSPDSLQLCFSNGDCLLLIDDSEQYESFVSQSEQGHIVI